MVQPREIVSSRGKTLLFLLIGAGFVAIALLLPDDGGDQTWRWLCLLFFGLCTAVFAVLLVRPQRVLLDHDGFTIDGGLARAPRRVRWRDCEGFFVYRLPRGGRMVAYKLAPQARPDSYWGDLNRRWGADGVLPRTLPGSSDRIVADLNAYREEALGR